MTAAAGRGDGVILVAGAGGGIGRAVVHRAAQLGFRVLGYGRRGWSDSPLDRPPDTRAWLASEPSPAISAAPLATMLEQLGPLRAIVFCVGSSSSKRPVAETPFEEWVHLYRDNVVTLAELWTEVAPWARSAGAGLVALSSDATATSRSGNGAYTAAKAALEALVITLAKEEAAFGVRANVLAPSLVRSPMAEAMLRRKGVADAEAHYRSLPWGRPLSVDEVAQVALDIAVAPGWCYASGQVFRLAVRDA